MNDEVRREETGDIEAESGGVDSDVAEDHDGPWRHVVMVLFCAMQL